MSRFIRIPALALAVLAIHAPAPVQAGPVVWEVDGRGGIVTRPIPRGEPSSVTPMAPAAGSAEAPDNQTASPAGPEAATSPDGRDAVWNGWAVVAKSALIPLVILLIGRGDTTKPYRRLAWHVRNKLGRTKRRLQSMGGREQEPRSEVGEAPDSPARRLALRRPADLQGPGQCHQQNGAAPQGQHAAGIETRLDEQRENVLQ